MSKKARRKLKSTAIRVLFVCLFVLLCAYMSSFLPEIQVNDGGEESVKPEKTEKTEKTFEEKLSVLPKLEGEYLSEDFYLSDGVFNGSTDTLVLLSEQVEKNLPDLPKWYYATSGSEEEQGVQTPVFSSSMGYIFYDDEDKVKVLSNTLSPLFANEDEVEFLQERDKLSRPVFLLNSVYVAQDITGEFVETEYSKDLDRGIDFGYPSYYGSYENQSICITKGDKGYGFSRVLSEKEQKEREEREKEKEDGNEQEDEEDDSIIAQAGYAMAYNFSEGRGCIKDFKNRLYFFDEMGRLPAGGLVNIIYGPKDDSEKYLGYYYFNEGLTRACEKTFSGGELVSEREIIIRRDGREMPLPADYSIVSYSDGMILLEKKGYMGYMNSDGTWITNPTFTYARPFFEGLAVVGSAGGKKGVIDKSGHVVIPAIFDEISDCSGGVICLYSKEHGWFFVNKLRRTQNVQ